MWHKFDTNSPQVVKADNLTSQFGTEDSRQLRQRIYTDLAPFAVDLALRFSRTLERHSYQHATNELNHIHRLLCIDDLNLCADIEELRQAAKRYAEQCRVARQNSQCSNQAYEACAAIVTRYHLSPPKFKSEELEPAINRMCCDKWWFGKIKTLRLRNIESISRSIELVNRCRASYASDYTVKLKRQQKEQNRLYLSSTYITNENGESYSLQDLADRSTANPAIRRSELMVRIKGFEIVAGLSGHVGEFYTLTTPSRMHACLRHGVQNPNFDGTTTNQAGSGLFNTSVVINTI